MKLAKPLNIIVVDDDPTMLQWYEAFFNDSKHHLVESLVNGHELFDILNENCVDAVLLDIELEETTGLKLARSLAIYQIEIVFVTAHNKYAIDGYEHYPFDFLLKPIDKVRLAQTLDKLAHKKGTEGSTQKIGFKVKEGLHFVEVNDILFIEKYNRKLLIHLEKKDSIQITESLNNIEMKLEKYDFYRIHKSYLIPLARVESLSKDDFMNSFNLVLRGTDTTLQVSKHKINELKGKFMKSFDI
ncbi:LytTR family DNA-binding domain-containing protein [Shouchella sp. 1P09AA]|uniref:LytR/AlgR family response regulator transcription factor n=1 Tax=unclassified Shouchella TaxID=2893065 RepID=UPI0039A28177